MSELSNMMDEGMRFAQAEESPAETPAERVRRMLLERTKQNTAPATPQTIPTPTPQAVTPVVTTPGITPKTPETQPQTITTPKLSGAELVKQKLQERIKQVPTSEAPKVDAKPMSAMDRLKAEVQKKQDEKDKVENAELWAYMEATPPPAELQAAQARGQVLITQPAGGTSMAEFPGVPDGAYDEVGDLVIDQLQVVSYPEKEPIFAAFGDKSEYEGMLKAAGFKPTMVYFMPKPGNTKKTPWAGAKHAPMYVAKGQAAKDAFERAWANANDPVAVEGRKYQHQIDSRRVEMEREKQKFQTNVDKISRNAHAYSDEGYDEGKHRKSYAYQPDRITAIPTPRRLGRKPLSYSPYQLAAVNFINDRIGGPDDSRPDDERGTILADAPGVGKTMPAIGVISSNPSIKKVLVVCPAVMVPTWIKEMKKWLAGDHVRNPITDKLKVSIGRYDAKAEIIPDITVISYESLRLGARELANPERIGQGAWDYVVLDESHRVKDEHSVQACVIMGGRPKRRKTENPLVPETKVPGENDISYPGIPSKRRLLLTGTPIPSYSWELYANLHFVRPDIFNDEDEFMYQFAVMKAFRTTTWRKNKASGNLELNRIFITKPVKPHNMTLLNKLLFGGGTYQSKSGKKQFDGLIMRRIHKDLLPLGPEFNWPTKPNPAYLAITDQEAEKDAAKALDARSGELTLLEKKIQEAIARNASPDELAELEHEYNERVKVSFQRVAKVRKAIGMRKAPYAAKEAALQANGSSDGEPNKVLIFAHHKEVIERIAADIEFQFKAMKHPEWKVGMVYGATGDKKREESFEQFQSDPNYKVIVASYKVLKEGITLTAANKVIHAELMPNPIDYEQAYARAWRRGQKRHVDETYVWLPRSFDQRLYNIASGKYAASNRILNFRLPEPEPKVANSSWWKIAVAEINA